MSIIYYYLNNSTYLENIIHRLLSCTLRLYLRHVYHISTLLSCIDRSITFHTNICHAHALSLLTSLQQQQKKMQKIILITEKINILLLN